MAKRILIVDDDSAVLDVMSEALCYEGYDVRTETRCDDILSMIDEYKPDALLIDYLLKGINGGDVCGRIKSDPVRQKLPVVILSAYPKVIDSLGYYGCNAFIAKPFNLDQLINKIQELTTNTLHI